MRGRIVLGAAGVPLVAVMTLALAAPDAGAGGPLTDRAFTIRADAFPVDPAPGVNRTDVGVRPAATEVTLSNAPASAYGRAAAGDAGTIELYTGPPPPGSVAECDATAPNLPREATATPAGMALAARCDQRPSARTTAVGAPLGGVSRSVAAGDGGGDALTADASAEVQGLVAGAIRVGSAIYTASVRATGQPGGAAATGRIVVSDATVAGVPVVIGPDGVTVDESNVPTDLVPLAAEAVRTALSQGKYSDVRVVQPTVTVSPDGTRAEVSGGGLFFYGTSADPKSNYFLQFTVVGGSALVALGGEATPAVAPAAPGPDAAIRSEVARPADVTGATGTAGPPVLSRPQPATPGAELALTTTSDRRVLARAWRGWWWLAGAVIVAGGAAAVGRRRVARWWDTTADRYVRG